MRFLTGMLFGTALTLLAATAVDAPTHALLDHASSQAESVWQRLLQSTSAALFETTGFESAGIPGPSAADQTITAAETSEPVPVSAPISAPASNTEPESELAKSDHLFAADLFAADLSAETQAATLAAARFDLPPLHVREADTASVWVPFHSERSALGFARRLTSEIQHPFSVERRGPGAYQVVYQVASTDEIPGLEARIAEVTGK